MILVFEDLKQELSSFTILQIKVTVNKIIKKNLSLSIIKYQEHTETHYFP
jgi:hypothetical protein